MFVFLSDAISTLCGLRHGDNHQFLRNHQCEHNGERHAENLRQQSHTYAILSFLLTIFKKRLCCAGSSDMEYTAW